MPGISNVTRPIRTAKAKDMDTMFELIMNDNKAPREIGSEDMLQPGPSNVIRLILTAKD